MVFKITQQTGERREENRSALCCSISLSSLSGGFFSMETEMGFSCLIILYLFTIPFFLYIYIYITKTLTPCFFCGLLVHASVAESIQL